MIVSAELLSPSISHNGFVAGRIEFNWPLSDDRVRESDLPETCVHAEIYDRSSREFQILKSAGSRSASSDEGWWSDRGLVIGLDATAQSTVIDFAKLLLSSTKSLAIRFIAVVDADGLPGALKKDASMGFESGIYDHVMNGGSIPLHRWSFLLHDTDSSEHLQ